MKRLLYLLFILTSSLLLSSCGNKYYYDLEKINITTTTNIMKDLADRIGGEKVNVYSLMGPGIDPHQYIARPNDFIALDKADLIIASGLHLEGKIIGVIESFENDGNKNVLNIGTSLINSDKKDLLIENENFGGLYDPHFWFDINLYIEATTIIKDKLILLDSNNREYYQNNFDSYLTELLELIKYAKDNFSKIKENNRYLITAHDAFEYLGKEFGFTVMSLQGLSTEAEVSPSDVKEIIDIILKYQIIAIFPETSVPIETITSVKEALNRKNYKVTIGGNLYSDSLGGNSDDDTYIKMYKKNIDTIVASLGGGNNNE
ncbi:metal ABC transporter solute-binding protein, Zn/Mn family [Haploplasma modicum]|uniref:metal ABC transporter solute-binding protein, Zn/Mn family n=1 Tax=Haploplasma modicum TaxID=2150 RepID=UPI00214B2792|nr:zinc ABC transporter substrate-binding protein [Haploplasma modicum]MCR1808597.1 zinc ABC transporter substrate-binding protein [Haploplasma modicum]